jgi:hypothetical protein
MNREGVKERRDLQTSRARASRAGRRSARRSSWGVNSAGDGGGTLESDDAEHPAASHLRLVVR